VQGEASILPAARPPVGQFFLGRVFDWIALVSACALPLVVITWRQFTPAERAGEVLGVCAWVVAMVIVGERLRWPSRDETPSLRGALMRVIWNRWTSREADRRSKMLRAGALVTALVHGVLAIFAGAPGLFLWFTPAVLVASNLPLLSELESGFWNALTWTLVCGAQSAGVAWLCGGAISAAPRLARRRGRP
jgi:hypothetical protein